MAAPELRLNVTLDLAAFRTQLTKLTSTAKSEIEDQDKIAIPVGIKSSVTKKDATAVTSEIYKTIKESALQGSGGKIRIPVSIKPSITKKDVTDFKKAVQDSLSGISVNVKANVQGGGFAGSSQGAAGLMQYMQQQGMIGKTASGMTMSMRNKSAGGSGFRALPEGASQAGAGVEFSEMMRRFRKEIAALTTQPKKYQQLLNALPDRKITTDLADVASRRSRAAEMPSFMPIQQKLGPGELEKKITGDLAQYLKSMRIPNPWVGPTGDYQKFIGNISRATRQLTSQALLPPSKAVKLLPPGSSSTFQQVAAARTQVAYQRSAARSATVLGGPSGPAGGGGGGGLPPSGGGNVPPGGGNAPVGGGGGAPPRGGGGAFGGMQFAMPKLPGTGIVQALGTEFAFAAKQVLLFGAAYKALAFLTDFPSKVGEAVGQLQSFRNTIKAISPTANEAAQSSQFILDVVDKYNVPLQSARDGFTKLYASMQPAGFNGGEIRDLFLGISQAAATFGMSADKVDRVNYAFAQMASKGQIMSEELKGQLGDVLPGAMSIFAEAAGFKGPKAIQDFSKALEDGAYKGGAMKTLLTNVGTIMRKEFGPGAEGAARTFQGSMNRMQNSLTLFYETFEPVAIGFLNAVVMPITSGIKTLTDGFNAFFTGQAAQTAGGNALVQQLNDLKPSFDGILANLKGLIPSFQLLGDVILNVAKILTVIAGNPIVGFLLKIYTNILLVNGVFTLLGGRVLLGLVSSLGAAIAKFIALNFAVASLQRTSVVANSTLAGTQLQLGLLSRGATGALGPIGLLKTALVGLARFSVILVGIEIVINGLAELDRLNKSLDKIAGFSSKEYTAEVKGLSKEDVNSRIIVNRKAQSSAAKELKQFEGVPGQVKGLVTGRDEELRNRMVVMQTQELILKNAKNNKSQAQLDKERTEKELAKIKLDGGDDGKKAAQKEERQAKLQDKLANRQQQLAIDAAAQKAALDQSSFDSRLRMSDAEYDHRRALQDSYFEREISGLDSIEARQKKFQQDLKTIENRRIDSIRKAELDSVKAVQDLRTASIKATAVTGGAPGGAYLQGNIGPTSTGPHFDVKKQGGGFFPRNYLDPYVAVNGAPLSTGTTVPGGTFAAHQARGSHGWDYAFGAGRHAATLKGGAEWMGGVPTAHGEKREFKIPTGEIFSFLHGGSEGINARPISAATRPGAFAMGRRNDKADNKLELEQQQATIKLSEELLRIRYANQLAIEETITLVKQNLDNIFPVKEQQLENDLLRLRNDLESKGVAKEIIDMEVEKAKRTKESIYLLEEYTKEIKKNQDALDAYNKQKTFTAKDKLQMDFLKEKIDQLNKAKVALPKAQAESNQALTEGVGLAATSSFESTMTSLKNQMKMARAFTPGQELKTQIGLDHPTATPEQQQILFDTTQAKNALEELKQKANDTASNMSESLTGAFKNIVTGSMTLQEGLATSFRSIGDFFADMVTKMIADYLKLLMIEGLKNIFSMFGPSLPGAAGPTPPKLGPAFANGGIAFGGFTAFAEGGVVTGPTLGLVGEGRYNEAVIPLPDGKSVPVQLAGGTEGATAPINTNIVVNVKNGQSDSQVTGNQGNQLGREIEGAVRQVILKEIRPGGIIYGSR